MSGTFLDKKGAQNVADFRAGQIICFCQQHQHVAAGFAAINQIIHRGLWEEAGTRATDQGTIAHKDYRLLQNDDSGGSSVFLVSTYLDGATGAQMGELVLPCGVRS